MIYHHFGSFRSRVKGGWSIPLLVMQGRITQLSKSSGHTCPYKSMMTPYEKFKSLPDAESYLKPGLTFLELDRIAKQVTDNEAARQLQEAKSQLFQVIQGQEKRALQ